MFEFDVVSGAVVSEVIAGDRGAVLDVVRATYLAHHDGDTVNPNSYFLRFPEKPDARIIALPAHLGTDAGVAGIKWIASFPSNIEQNVPRASAVLLLNDYRTGYPFACLEASQISAGRTAASAALGAEALVGSRSVGSTGIVGAGVIARTIVEFLVDAGWDLGRVTVHDRVPEYAEALVGRIGDRAVVGGREDTLGSELVVFATTAAAPHVVAGSTFTAGQTVLNVSLRDLGPDVILGAFNIVDDVDHCLTADTSPHLAEQQVGHRDFVDGTLAAVLRGEVKPADDRPRVFSPFGLGVLDLAVGTHVHRVARAQGRVHAITDFFGQARRW